MGGDLDRSTTAAPPRTEVSSSLKQVSSSHRDAYAAAACSQLSTSGPGMSVTRVNVSDDSAPSSDAPGYWIPRTEGRGMPCGRAPPLGRRIGRDARGSAIRDG